MYIKDIIKNMQTFIINQHSTLPLLKMELVQDGRHDFNKFYDVIQDCTITFTMVNKSNNMVKICNAPAYIQLKEHNCCNEEYLICYDWKERDVRDKGIFDAYFTLNFNGNITSETYVYPTGKLILPIEEKLEIVIQ
jgi:hypothetical protein